MEYISNYIWEKGSEETQRVSLVLQQAQVCKKSVLLACVCNSGNAKEVGITESGYFTEGLVEWFHKSFLKQCEKNVADTEIEKLLQKEIERLEADIKRFTNKKQVKEALHFWGILLRENRFWIFTKGDCEGYLLNRRFQKKQMRKLELGEWSSGQLQRGLGILLCTPGFISHIESGEVAEVLIWEGKSSEERMQKRLKELWEKNQRCGENHSVGAIYLCT